MPRICQELERTRGGVHRGLRAVRCSQPVMAAKAELDWLMGKNNAGCPEPNERDPNMAPWHGG